MRCMIYYKIKHLPTFSLFHVCVLGKLDKNGKLYRQKKKKKKGKCQQANFDVKNKKQFCNNTHNWKSINKITFNNKTKLIGNHAETR